ncbi:transketolase [Nibrella saemangeumensis]|uniref:Transketolase n=1 Tax=Nibrella saemangeumensis TaxID=1084526 RepID=A0ABP8NBJ8_9BACT
MITETTQTTELTAIASQVRRDILRMVHAVASGHPGGSLGCADLLVSLFFEQMNLKTDTDGQVVFNMDGAGEDLFFLSNGHISPLYYAVLARRGYFRVSELATFRKLNSRLQGHPATAEHLPGIRIASGSLGQGLSVACGAAYGKKIRKDPNLVFVLMGDGEQQEGQVWEAAMFAPHNRLDNLIAIIDFNGQQIDGPTTSVLDNRDLGQKYRSFGWHVIQMDGNHYDDLNRGLTEARQACGQGMPICIIMKTEMGQGVDFMMHTHKWHGTAPNNDQLSDALAQLPETLGDY